MNLVFGIARRYLFGKKSTNVINIITWISIIGMSIGATALILILSVFNGFESLLAGLLNSFNPDIKIELVEGKFYERDSILAKNLDKIEGIAHVSFVLEETSFFEYKGSQEVGLLKGVDKNYMNVTSIDSTILRGNHEFTNEAITYGLLGIGMNSKLSINQNDPLTAINAYMPVKQNRGPLGKGFKNLSIYPSGVFSVGNDVDGQYILIGFEQMNYLLGSENQFSAIEVKLTSQKAEKKVIEELKNVLGPKFSIKNKAQQDDGFFKIMNIEKWVSYLIACLTMLIIAFNMVGSLWMIVLEKKKDISILKSMGFSSSKVKSVFLTIGIYIASIGLLVGIILSILFYALQTNYGIIAIPDGFMIDAYPIELRWSDFFIVGLTVMVIGFLASILPSVRSAKISAFVRQE